MKNMGRIIKYTHSLSAHDLFGGTKFYDLPSRCAQQFDNIIKVACDEEGVNSLLSDSILEKLLP